MLKDAIGFVIAVIVLEIASASLVFTRGNCPTESTSSTAKAGRLSRTCSAEPGYDKVVTVKKYEVKFPKGTDKAIVDKLAGICKDIVLNDQSCEEVLKVYYAKPLLRDAEQMNKEDPEEVKELESSLGTLAAGHFHRGLSRKNISSKAAESLCLSSSQ